MKNRELNRQHQVIVSLIDSTNMFTSDNIELQGHWGKYLCVLVSGFLENAIFEIYSEYINSSASPNVRSFANKKLSGIQNPNSNRFLQTAQSFSKEWGDNLSDYFDSYPAQKSAIDSIMANRHQVAHGKPTNISVVRVREYLDRSVEVITFIEAQTGV